MPNYRLPEKAIVTVPRELPMHSRFFFFAHRITYAPNLRVALRYFQALEVYEVLRVYGYVTEYANRHEMANPLLREIQEHLRNYLEWCLVNGWQTFPLQNPKRE